MSFARLLALAAALTLVVAPTARASPPDEVQAEVNYLLSYIGTSGCRFYRNGIPYDGKRAQDHLREKYLAVAATGQIGTTEDFLVKVATRSSLTGWPYKVACGTAGAVPSGTWLLGILTDYRAGRRVSGAFYTPPLGSRAGNRA